MWCFCLARCFHIGRNRRQWKWICFINVIDFLLGGRSICVFFSPLFLPRLCSRFDCKYLWLRILTRDQSISWMHNTDDLLILQQFLFITICFLFYYSFSFFAASIVAFEPAKLNCNQSRVFYRLNEGCAINFILRLVVVSLNWIQNENKNYASECLWKMIFIIKSKWCDRVRFTTFWLLRIIIHFSTEN